MDTDDGGAARPGADRRAAGRGRQVTDAEQLFRAARPAAPGRDRRAVRARRRQRPGRSGPLRAEPVPGRHRPARRVVLLASEQHGRDPRGLHRVPAGDAGAGRAAGCRRTRPARIYRAGDASWRPAIGTGSGPGTARRPTTRWIGPGWTQLLPAELLGRLARWSRRRAGPARAGGRPAAGLRHRPGRPADGRPACRPGRTGWPGRSSGRCAPFGPADLVEKNFGFYGRTLSGVPQLRERWKRGVSLVEGAAGEALGRLYVERHFPPAAKQRMDELVANLLEAYRRDISELPWMSDGDQGPGAGQAGGVHPEDRLPRPVARLQRAGRPGRRPRRQRPAGRRVRTRPAAGQDRHAGGPARVVHVPADGQRLLQPGDERDRLPGGDSAAAVLRSGRPTTR